MVEKYIFTIFVYDLFMVKMKIVNNTRNTYIWVKILRTIYCSQIILGPSINGLVTNRCTKLCCHGFVLVLFQSTTANTIDSEHNRDHTKLFLVCKIEILQVTVNKIEVLSSFYVDF